MSESADFGDVPPRRRQAKRPGEPTALEVLLAIGTELQTLNGNVRTVMASMGLAPDAPATAERQRVADIEGLPEALKECFGRLAALEAARRPVDPGAAARKWQQEAFEAAQAQQQRQAGRDGVPTMTQEEFDAAVRRQRRPDLPSKSLERFAGGVYDDADRMVRVDPRQAMATLDTMAGVIAGSQDRHPGAAPLYGSIKMVMDDAEETTIERKVPRMTQEEFDTARMRRASLARDQAISDRPSAAYGDPTGSMAAELAEYEAEDEAIATTPVEVAPERVWEPRLKQWAQFKMWMPEWQGRPGQADCAVPEEILQKFGFGSTPR